MSFRVPDDDDDDSFLPSTPDSRNYGTAPRKFGAHTLGDQPSSTPAGAPSTTFMNSSLMKAAGASPKQNPFAQSDLNANTPPVKNPFAAAGPSKAPNPFSAKPPPSLFAAPKSKSSTPVGRSFRSSGIRKPSRLREQVVDDEDDQEENEEEEEDVQPRKTGSSFQVDYGHEDDDAEGEEDEDYQPGHPSHNRSTNAFMEDFDQYSGDEEGADGEADMWLDMEQDGGDENMEMGDVSDLMMLNTPAADERIFREAEGIFRATAKRSGLRRHSFKCAADARNILAQSTYASVAEPPELILDTESLIARLYKDGVGPEEDDERLDETLAAVTGQLTGLWKRYVDALPLPTEEHAAEIGPSPQATPFEKAAYLATLALQIHHTRTNDDKASEPLPETLFRWLSENHNPYPNQVQEVLRYRPCPASHSMFWPTVCMALLRGQVADAQNLLLNAGWEKVKANRPGEAEYSGRALDNVRLATEETCAMLNDCPGRKGDWEIWNSDWTLFRIKARGKLEHLRRFAEGKNARGIDMDASDSYQSLAAAARVAESQVPWEIYENLNVVFEIALGSPEVIVETAQDWCEATIGLFGWWDETRPDAQLQGLVQDNGADGFVDRLARSLRIALDAGFHLNPINPVEVGIACVFEDNAKAIVAILRTWSLPVAAAVAEIASLGRWLPQHQPSALYAFEDLDQEDLEVLGVNPQDPDEIDGIKDNTLIQYAQELANYKDLATVQDRFGGTRDGWEVAIHVLGRMDSQQRAEDTVGELVINLLQEVNVDSSEMVNKVWRLLNELGMVQFAEQVAEVKAIQQWHLKKQQLTSSQHFGDILKDQSFRYGEAMWYYALSHRPGKVRDVMHFLIAWCLTQSAAYPPAAELDDHLHRLLKRRNATLEDLAKQDLDAAELLGKMLAGYATLRKFYEIRDDESLPLSRRHRSAAAALSIVIASADDNIRGGLYDASRDAIVGEDFLLALLGEVLVFVNQTSRATPGAPPLLTLEQLDVLLKAVEDLQSVGGRVYETCKDFFQLVLASAPAQLKGSKPADLLKKSSGSAVLAGPTMLASQLQRSVAAQAPPKGSGVKRGWDWRSGLDYSTTAEDVLRILRLGLTRDLARLWVVEADGAFM